MSQHDVSANTIAMSIKQLPPDVVAQIESSIAISSLNSVILGLVKNSLDAQCSKVNISVDYRKGNCSVEDNGLGIAPTEFLEDGGLGKLHCKDVSHSSQDSADSAVDTSKYPPDSGHYGSHGTFLASAAALSLLSITSRHHQHRSHNSLSIHNSKVLARNTPALPNQRLLIFPHGTRVTVRDLFGSMPVRVKQRALEMDKPGAVRELEQLVLGIVSLLLVWPGEVSLKVRDATSANSLSLRAKEASQPSNSGEEKDYPVLLGRTPKLLSQASLHDNTDAGSWVEVGARGFGVSVRGCVCLVPTASKRLQFIAIGIEPLPNEQCANVLYEEVNSVFANSAFGVIEGESDDDVPAGKENRSSLRIRDLKARKGIDRWPIFALQIRFEDVRTKRAHGVEEILDGRSADLTQVTDLLRALAYQFLKKHHFRPKPLYSTLHQSTVIEGLRGNTGPGSLRSERRRPSPSARDHHESATRSLKKVGRSKSLGTSHVPETRSGSPFDAWTRVKVGRPSSATKMSRATTQQPETPRRPLLDSAGKLLRKPFDDTVPTIPARELRLEGLTSENYRGQSACTGSQSDTIVWTDPVTRITSTIDSRTGCVVRSESTAGKRISLRTPAPAEGQSRHERPPWIAEMLSEWQNPAFATTEPPIPRIPDPLEAANRPVAGALSNHCDHLKPGGPSETSMLQFAGRVSRQALRDAQVIAQVDSKFILVKLAMQPTQNIAPSQAETRSSDPGEVLVLIDQHAADERCRVEELQKEYFASASTELGAHTSQLEKPMQFEVSKQDGLLLTDFREHFEYWGILYKVQVQAPDTARAGGDQQVKMKVQVRNLPPSILERCRLEPRLLIELVRKEAWRLREEPELAASSAFRRADISQDGENDWVRRFHGCPQGILDLINSRACRSEFPALSPHIPEPI